MRVLVVAVVAALALTATCDVVAAEASKTSTLSTIDESLSTRGFRGDNNNRRSLKSRNEELDADALDASEERAFAEALKVEERAVANAKYRRWYKADLKPWQVRTILGVGQKNLRKTQRELSRLYLGYYSFYTHMQRKRGSSDKARAVTVSAASDSDSAKIAKAASPGQALKLAMENDF